MAGQGNWPFGTVWFRGKHGATDTERLVKSGVGDARPAVLADWFFDAPSGGGGGGATVALSIADADAGASTRTSITTNAISWAAGDAIHVALSVNYSGSAGAWALANATGLIWGTPKVDETTGDNRFVVWTAIATASGSAALSMSGASADIWSYQIRKATVTGGTLAWGTAQVSPSTSATSITLSGLTGIDADDYQIATTAQMGTQSGGSWAGATATPRAGWTGSQTNTATITNWCAFLHGQVSPVGGEATASVTGLTLPGGSPAYRLAVVPLQVTASGGGGSYVSGPAVGIGGGVAVSTGALVLAAPGAGVAGGAIAALGVRIAAAPGAGLAGGMASAPGVLVLSVPAAAAGFSLSPAPGAVIRSAQAQAIAVAVAQAAGLAILSAPATALAAALGVAAGALILAAPAASIAGALVAAELTNGNIVTAVATAIGGGAMRGGGIVIVAGSARSVSNAVTRATAAVILSAPGIAAAAGLSRADGALILSGRGSATGGAVLRAAGAMVLASPGVALSLASAAASPAVLRVGRATASGMAIAAGLGENAYLPANLPFAYPGQRARVAAGDSRTAVAFAPSATAVAPGDSRTAIYSQPSETKVGQ